MPTQYTSLLGLAKPQTGELSGTWGTTVNEYITDYLDAAVAGAQVISGAQTAVTLSTTNGSALVQAGAAAAGSSQYAIIRCTGNPASQLTVTAPAASKVYLVINATSTNQSVKLVGAGPTTGVTVAAAQAALLAWSGTDFVLIATTDVSKLSGVLPVANGGTGITSFGTGVATALGQNVTGSGGIVLATSPTITTPTLATPSVTGQLTAAAGAVGAPAITTTGDLNTGIFFPAADTIAFSEGGVESLRIDAVGNVGIGTSSPVSALQVAKGEIRGGGASLIESLQLIGGSSGTNNQILVSGSSALFAPNSILFYTNNAESVRIDSSGNVGIGGITTPLSRLDVLTAGGNCLGTFRNGTTTAQVGVTSSGGGQAYFGSTTNHLTRLIQNGTTQFQISTTGLVQMDNGYGSLATFYGCRAWINFNGTAVISPASMTGVRASGNVSSVLDNGTGDYTINFTNAMPDVNYAVVGTAMLTNEIIVTTPGTIAYNTGSIRIGTRGGAGGLADPTYVNLAVFR